MAAFPVSIGLSRSGAFASAMADKEKVVRLKLSRENPAYGSLLALGAAGFSVHDSVDLIDSDHNEFTMLVSVVYLGYFVLYLCKRH
uniref:Uncharacterized protein n=1 Tax=Parascaris equorum TaxID=6256 RepID=A0A914RE61_PAREQ